MNLKKKRKRNPLAGRARRAPAVIDKDSPVIRRRRRGRIPPIMDEDSPLAQSSQTLEDPPELDAPPPLPSTPLRRKRGPNIKFTRRKLVLEEHPKKVLKKEITSLDDCFEPKSPECLLERRKCPENS